MKKTLLLLSLLLSFGLFSCSDDDDNNDDNPKKDIQLKLKADKTTIAPFDKLTVSIDLDMDLLINNYDSVVWKTNGIWWNGIITIPDTSDERDVNITDYRLGKNKVSALGYKDGAIISETSVEYEVTKPTVDFFTIKWSGPHQNTTNHYMTDRPVKTNDGSLRWEGIQLALHHFSEGEQYQYAILDFMPYSTTIHKSEKVQKTMKSSSVLPDIENYDFFGAIESYDEERRKEAHLMTRSFFHEYITLIYGKSILIYEGNDIEKTILFDEYNKRFKNPIDKVYPRFSDACPVEIWETPSSYICMFASASQSWYNVIAEPRL
ncbi:hypothetical protein [Dysgonomonas sp. ZJ279]|uniref:hypothetical protein n=1 Tax=Dysgonomonas sp. ZJ279 TaxID=2709796 RepID=UPI0013ED24D4|nr:hypothetical protein [Dysgonomonas sp. ZJ279]